MIVPRYYVCGRLAPCDGTNLYIEIVVPRRWKFRPGKQSLLDQEVNIANISLFPFLPVSTDLEVDSFCLDQSLFDVRQRMHMLSWAAYDNDRGSCRIGAM
jgi:hypothetical protein